MPSVSIRFKQRFCFLLILVFLPLSLTAQVNTESMRLEVVNGFKVSVRGSLSIQQGNTELYVIGLRPRFDYRRGRHDAFLTGRYQFIQKGDNKLINNRFTHLRYNFDFKTWFILELFGQVEYDEARLLNQRTLLGLGLRIKVYKNTRMAFFLGTTPMLEVENLDANRALPEEGPRTTVGRWSNYFVIKVQIQKDFNFLNVVYVQPRFNKFEDVRALNETAIQYQITKHLGLGAELAFRYDSRPALGVKKNDLTFTNTVTVNF
jgi:putative salt-induced outer membrane protein YdiY